MYKKSLAQQQNEYASLESAREESESDGFKKGIEKNRMETVKALLRSGDFSISKISKILGLDLDYIKKVKDSLQLNQA